MTWDPDAAARRADRQSRREHERAVRASIRRDRYERRPEVPDLPSLAAMLLDILVLRQVTPTPARLRRFGGHRTVASWPLGKDTFRFQQFDGYSEVTFWFSLFSDGIVRYRTNSYDDDWRTVDSNTQSAANNLILDYLALLTRGPLPAGHTARVSQLLRHRFMEYAVTRHLVSDSDSTEAVIAAWMKHVHANVRRVPGATPIVEYRALDWCLRQLGRQMNQPQRLAAWKALSPGSIAIPNEVISG